MYNQVGTNIAIREFISTIGNLSENFGYKTDDFTGDGPADGARTGNWPVMWELVTTAMCMLIAIQPV